MSWLKGLIETLVIFFSLALILNVLIRMLLHVLKKLR